MRTEEQIVDQLLNIYHGGDLSNDNVVNERLMRDFLRKHRGSNLSKFTNQGMTVTSECFQDLGQLTLEKDSTGDYSLGIPAIVLLNYHGISVTKNGWSVPVTDYFPYKLSKKNIFNKFLPKATLRGSNLVVYPGIKDLCFLEESSDVYQVISEFYDEIAEFDDNEKIKVDVDAVLYDPGEAANYDWTKDPYPCPSEIIDALTTSTLARDLQLMVRQYVDENINNKEDKVPTNEGV